MLDKTNKNKYKILIRKESMIISYKIKMLELKEIIKKY